MTQQCVGKWALNFHFMLLNSDRHTSCLRSCLWHLSWKHRGARCDPAMILGSVPQPHPLSVLQVLQNDLHAGRDRRQTGKTGHACSSPLGTGHETQHGDCHPHLYSQPLYSPQPLNLYWSLCEDSLCRRDRSSPCSTSWKHCRSWVTAVQPASADPLHVPLS